MLILILFAFLAGIVTILSPCILPILPIVLSSSLTGGKKRPFGIVTGFIVSFTFFTLLLSSIVQATGIGSESLRSVAIMMIGLFGVSLLIPATQVFLERLFSRLSSLTPYLSPLHPSPGTHSGADFFSGLVVGLSLGLLWTPCVGPILASVITLAITGTTSASAFLITLAYSIGTALPMLAITYGGRTLLQKNHWLLENTAKIQKGFGVIMIAMAVALFFGVDRKLQTILLTAFPSYGAGLTAIENNALVQKQLGTLGSTPQSQIATPSSLPDYGAAPNPEFTGATKWLNSEPLSLSGNLKGKVVLVDFWTYTCINCIRTLPYITDWYSKYKDKGLVIIGVHAPEFEFEKVESNVTKAMKDYKIEYPVVQDNEFAIWKSYRNQYWPAHYLIDAKGHVRATHFGEGAYAETEKQIQDLLKEAGEEVSIPVSKESPAPLLSFGARISPETYLGSERKQANDGVTLRGAWKTESQSITSLSETSTLTLRFRAGKVYLVMSGKSETRIKVSIDGMEQPGFIVDRDQKYDIFDSKSGVGEHELKLVIPAGVSAYAFTFGE